MSEALHAEWTKLRTLRGTLWMLLGILAVTVGLGAAVTASARYGSPGASPDLTRLSLTGIDLSQAVVAMFAVQAVGGEYSSGMIRVTLAAVPRRWTVLAAKAAVVGGLTLAVGAAGVAGALLAGRILLLGNGFTAAHGYQALSPADGPTLRAALGSVLYLTLVALLSLGIAAALREPAVAIGAVLGLLYLFPLIIGVVRDPAWHRHLEQIGPMTAGLEIQSTVNTAGLPISPWAGLGVLALWAAGSLGCGGLVLRLRDA
jgi:ABC-2 type transport system permease protein